MAFPYAPVWAGPTEGVEVAGVPAGFATFFYQGEPVAALNLEGEDAVKLGTQYNFLTEMQRNPELEKLFTDTMPREPTDYHARREASLS